MSDVDVRGDQEAHRDDVSQSNALTLDRYEQQVRIFDAVTSTTPDFVYLFDCQGRFQYANRRLLEVWGLTLPEVLGKTCRELGYEQWHHDLHMREIAQVIATRHPIKGEVPFKAPRTGIFGVYEYIFTPVFGAGGEVELIAGTTRDVTERRRAEDALRASEERYRTLFENMAEGFFLAEVVSDAAGRLADFRYLDVNRAFEQVTGLRREDTVGRTFREVVPAVATETWAALYARLVETGMPQRTVEFSPALGRHYSIVTYRPRAGQFACVFEDVTERRHERELLQAIFDNIPVLLVLYDPHLREFTLNNHAERVLGWTTAEANATDVLSLIYPDPAYRAEVVAYMQSLTPGFRELICRTKAGASIPVEWANVRLKDVVCIGIGVDVHERKRAEEAIRRSEESLREANAQLKDADRRKNEFLAVLSHELRNPLAPITNSLHILDRVQPGGEQANRAKQVIARQVTQLANLVNDLLEIARISRNKVRLQRERLDLNEIVRRTVEDNRLHFERLSVRLELQTARQRLMVLADPTRLAQVVSNLLQNAAKFTPPGGQTAVDVCTENSQAVVRVRDTGVGIRPDELTRLFEPFVQSDRTLDRSKGGLGLGLALVKGLVELHGGTVSAHSEGLGTGAEFVVRLPVDTTASLKMPTGAPTPTVARGRRILVIEDNQDAADSLRETLEICGHRTEVAYSGADGIAKARLMQPEVVLCDIGLPGMDGYQVARELRQNGCSAYLVAFSGYALPEDRQRAADAGFDAHLAKPATLDRITELLSRVGAKV